MNPFKIKKFAKEAFIKTKKLPLKIFLVLSIIFCIALTLFKNGNFSHTTGNIILTSLLVSGLVSLVIYIATLLWKFWEISYTDSHEKNEV